MANYRHNEVLHARIVERLKNLRKERKITQEQVIFNVGISIGDVETGRNRPTIDTLAILCDYYEVTLEEFFHGVETK